MWTSWQLQNVVVTLHFADLLIQSANGENRRVTKSTSHITVMFETTQSAVTVRKIMSRTPKLSTRLIQ